MDTLHEGASELENDDFGDCNLEQPSTDEEQHDGDATDDDAIAQELGTALTILQVKEINCRLGSNLPSEDDCSSGLDDENISADDYDIKLDDFRGTSSKPLRKWPTFHAEDSEVENNALRHTVSLPPADKLASAMKGSREKKGITPRKLSVSWAPDVYDPTPNSLSYCPKKKMVTRQQMKRDKKYGKGKQKGKNSRGGGSDSKEKKNYRKVETGRVKSSKGYKSSAEHVDFDSDDYDDDDILHTSDSSCGSSYWGKKGNKRQGAMPFEYAEAV